MPELTIETLENRNLEKNNPKNKKMAAVELVDTRIMSPMFTETPDRHIINSMKSPFDFCKKVQKKGVLEDNSITLKDSSHNGDKTLKQENSNNKSDYTEQLLHRINSLEKCIQAKNQILGKMKKEKIENQKEILFLKSQNQIVVSQSIGCFEDANLGDVNNIR